MDAMKLLSVNVSKPRTVEYLGRRFSTGIYKEPTEGRHRVGKVNVEGDGQGNLTVHGGHDTVARRGGDAGGVRRGRLSADDRPAGQAEKKRDVVSFEIRFRW